VMPAWNVDACAAEPNERRRSVSRGVNMTSDPQDQGRAGPRRPHMGSALGGLQRVSAARPLPHRDERDGDELFRHVSLGLA
jgi:hypothetical protein